MTSIISDALRAFLEANEVGVVGVKRKNGSVHMSTVFHLLDGDRLYITTESKRLKARSVARDGWMSYNVRGPERPYPSVSLEGPARVLREGIAERSRLIYLRFAPHLAENLTDEVLADRDRVLIEFAPERLYAHPYLEL